MLNLMMKSECARVLVRGEVTTPGRLIIRLAAPVRARTFFAPSLGAGKGLVKHGRHYLRGCSPVAAC